MELLNKVHKIGMRMSSIQLDGIYLHGRTQNPITSTSHKIGKTNLEIFISDEIRTGLEVSLSPPSWPSRRLCLSRLDIKKSNYVVNPYFSHSSFTQSMNHFMTTKALYNILPLFYYISMMKGIRDLFQ